MGGYKPRRFVEDALFPMVNHWRQGGHVSGTRGQQSPRSPVVMGSFARRICGDDVSWTVPPLFLGPEMLRKTKQIPGNFRSLGAFGIEKVFDCLSTV